MRLTRISPEVYNTRHEKNLQDLLRKYPGIPAEEITRSYNEARYSLEKNATIGDSIPELVSKDVEEKLRNPRRV